MQSESYRKVLGEDLSSAVVKFDEKTDTDYYTNQFDLFSEILITHARYRQLREFLKNNQDPVPKRQYDLHDRHTFVESLYFLLYQMGEFKDLLHLDHFTRYVDNLQMVVHQASEVIYKSYFQQQKCEQLI